jgi:uncharacterized membrane-anchored protein
MFIKEDETFTRTATDPIRRRASIADLTRRRRILFWCAILVSVGLCVSSYVGKSMNVGLAFAAAIQWMICFKFESEIRLLKVIDRLQGSDNLPKP